MHGDARIEGYHYCMPLETPLALNFNSFILTVGIMGVDSHARDMYGIFFIFFFNNSLLKQIDINTAN